MGAAASRVIISTNGRALFVVTGCFVPDQYQITGAAPEREPVPPGRSADLD
jgi:hypothetical protein